jgi:hypothetical protein
MIYLLISVTTVIQFHVLIQDQILLYTVLHHQILLVHIVNLLSKHLKHFSGRNWWYQIKFNLVLTSIYL